MRLLSADTALSTTRHGGKAIGLQLLMARGLPVPPTAVLEPGDVSDDLAIENLAKVFGDYRLLIARSSAPQEDSASQSCAGVFHSSLFRPSEIHQALTSLAAENAGIQRSLGNESDVPLLVQPHYGGFPGGVYLRDSAGNERLSISRLGPATVTSGSASEMSLVGHDDGLFRATMERLVEDLDGVLGGVDVEFVVTDESIVYLQFRPLNGSLPSPTSSSATGLTRSPHFPFPLTAFEASVWIPVLQRHFGKSIALVDRSIYEVPGAREAVYPMPTEDRLKEAEATYRDLFFEWESRYRESLQRIITCDDPRDGLRHAWQAWCRFYDEYFGNSARETVEAVRENGVQGMACSPELAAWIQSLAELDVTRPSDPSFVSFCDRYAFMLVRNNYIAVPSVVDQPARLRLLVESAKANRFSERRDPSLQLRVAWIAEDDNLFKLRFNYLLRTATERLGVHYVRDGAFKNVDQVWLFTLDELLSGSVHLPDIADDTDVDAEIPLVRSVEFDAEILSSGSVTGAVFREHSEFTPNAVYVAESIESIDYPMFTQCSAGIVAVGHSTYHSAIFARELGIPLYRSEVAVKLLHRGQSVRLSPVNGDIGRINVVPSRAGAADDIVRFES